MYESEGKILDDSDHGIIEESIYDDQHFRSTSTPISFKWYYQDLGFHFFKIVILGFWGFIKMKILHNRKAKQPNLKIFQMTRSEEAKFQKNDFNLI